MKRITPGWAEKEAGHVADYRLLDAILRILTSFEALSGTTVSYVISQLLPNCPRILKNSSSDSKYRNSKRLKVKQLHYDYLTRFPTLKLSK